MLKLQVDSWDYIDVVTVAAGKNGQLEILIKCGDGGDPLPRGRSPLVSLLFISRSIQVKRYLSIYSSISYSRSLTVSGGIVCIQMYQAQTERPYRSHRHPACLSCRKRKSRCKTRDAPCCIMCQVHGTECVFPELRESRARRAVRRPATTRHLRPRPQIAAMPSDGPTQLKNTHQVTPETPRETLQSDTTQSQNKNDELSDIMGLDAETSPDNPHIVSPAVADDNTILEAYLCPLPGSRRRMIRPTANGARPVLFNSVQRRPLGVACNQSLAGSKCQIIEKLIEPHEHDLIDLYACHSFHKDC